LVAVPFLLVPLAIAGCGGCGGDDENEASTTSPTTAHASTQPDSTKSSPKKSRSKESGSNQTSPNGGSKNAASSKSTSQRPGQPGKANGPATPGGIPDGKPVGTVPRGAGPGANEEAVARTLRAYLVSIAQGDGPQACAQLTSDAQRHVEREVGRAAPETKGSPCEVSIVLYQSSYHRAADGVRVSDVQVAGDRAKAVALHEAAGLVKHGRTWLIASYEL
jgi:hypothetical protein